MTPLTMREWLERERLSGLPHADFAADALTELNEGRDSLERDEQLLDDIDRATGDVIEKPEQIVECFKFRKQVIRVLNDAGVADGDVTGAQAAGLLRMFLPS